MRTLLGRRHAPNRRCPAACHEGCWVAFFDGRNFRPPAAQLTARSYVESFDTMTEGAVKPALDHVRRRGFLLRRLEPGGRAARHAARPATRCAGSLAALQGIFIQMRPAWMKFIAALAISAALAAAWRFTPLSDYVTAERVSSWARAVRETPWAPLVVIALYTPAAFVFFPRPLLTLLTVVAFGPWLGFVYGMTGILLSAYATYYAGRLFPPATVERLAGRHAEQVRTSLRRHGLSAVFALRIVPAAPFAIEGIMAGALRVKQWEYGLGTFLGMLPGVLATSVFGKEIQAFLEDPAKAAWWIAGAAVVALGLFTYFARRWIARQAV